MKYEPENLGVYNDPDLAKLVRVLTQELARVAGGFESISSVQFDELHVEPAKPRTGLTVLADGTDWNPGGGQGVYTYYNNTWNKLG